MGSRCIMRRGKVSYGLVIVDVRDHEGKEQVGREMHRVVRAYWLDLGPLIAMDRDSFFDMVRSIPYQSDGDRFPGQIVEVLSRPRYSLDRRILPALDCKKKAILLGAWAYGNGIPYRFLAVSHRPNKEVHHVMPQINSGTGWVNADATLPGYYLGMGQPATFATELEP